MPSEEMTQYTSINNEDGFIVSVLTNKEERFIQEIKFKNYHKPKRKKYCFFCRSQTNSLLLILVAYVTIFLIASIILIMSVLRLQDVKDNDKLVSTSKFSEDIFESKYKLSVYLKQMDRLFPKRLFKEFMWPFRSSDFNCSSLYEIKKFNYLTSGWTKNVFSFKLNGKGYALKTVNINGTDMKSCLEKNTREVCFDKASSKMYKEYILSRELTHSNIVKVLAWCVSSSNTSHDVAVISELCTPLDILSLLRMSFHQRLRIMLHLAQLMTYLAESPLGSVAINDFQRQQFVICGETLKLTDLDDLSIEEPQCNYESQCSQGKLNQLLSTNGSNYLNLKCFNNFCKGYNEKQNVINTYKHFVNLFLNITTPTELKKDVEVLFDTYTSTWDAKNVLKQTELLYKKYEKLQSGIGHT